MSIFFPGALGDLVRKECFRPSNGIESFGNNFIRVNAPVLGNNARIERKDNFSPDEKGVIVYELKAGSTLHIGIEKNEGEYPIATIGKKF